MRGVGCQPGKSSLRGSCASRHLRKQVPYPLHVFLVIYKKASTVSPDSPIVLFLLASSSIDLVGYVCVPCPV